MKCVEKTAGDSPPEAEELGDAHSPSGHSALLGRSRQGSPATFLFLLRGCHQDLTSSGPSGSWNLWREREKTMSQLGCRRVRGCTPAPEVRIRN